MDFGPADVAHEPETPVIDPTFDAAASLPPVGLGELASAMTGPGAVCSDVGGSTSMPTTPRGSRRASTASMPSMPSRQLFLGFFAVLDRAKASDSRSLAEKRPADVPVRDLQQQSESNKVRRLHLLSWDA